MAEGDGLDGLDGLLDQIGMGRWQIMGLVANFLVWFVLAPHTIGITLINAPVPFKCLPSNISGISGSASSSAAFEKEGTNETGSFFDSRCLDPEGSSTSTSLPINVTDISDLKKSTLRSCPSISYDNSIFESTVATEWNLICERSGLSLLFQNTYTIGLLFGCVLGGYVGDKLGRARAVLLASVVHGAAIFIVAFTSDIVLLLIGRFVIGVTNLMMLVTVVTLALETCPEKYRGPIGTGVGFPYSMGVALFGGLGIFLRNWRHLYIATTFPGVLIIPVAWLLDESPRWLLQAGRLDEATKIMEKASICNGVGIDRKEKVRAILNDVMKTEQMSMKKSVSEKPKSRLKNLKKLFWKSVQTPEIRKISLISPLIWFFNEFIYYGIIFNANRFSSSNPFLYVALTGVFDGVGVIVGSFAVYFGRKLTVAGSQLCSGILILLVLAVPEDLKWLQWVFIMTGFLMCACASQALFVYTPELFPTVIRARGFAFSNLTGYVGTLLAPFVPDVVAQYAWWLTNTILGSIGMLSFCLVMLLPETLGTPLCETVQDVEDRGKTLRERRKPEKSSPVGIDNPSLEKD